MNQWSRILVPVGRLMWKEYRIQRSLWLAMLIFGVVPQILLRILVTNAENRVASVWAAVVMIPFFFVIASTAILFAGEREERTSDWLLNLSVRPIWTLVTKWGFSLLATLSLILVLSVSALLLVWIPVDVQRVLADPQHDTSRAVAGFTFMLFSFVLWGSLGSLVSRRVITAVPAMGLWWATTLICVSLISCVIHAASSIGTDFVMMAAIVVGANLYLGWRWCLGHYIDAQTLTNLTTRIRERLRGSAPVASRVPKQTEVGDMWSREWQRLVWQERNRDSFHRLFVYGGCFAAVATAMAGRQLGYHQPELLMLLTSAIPLTMGVLGFRYDGEGQPLHFLNNRGINRRRLWCAKHFVWFPRTCAILSLIWIVALASESLINNRTIAGQSVARNSAAMYEHQDVAILTILLIYCSGHFAAVLFRRAILSLAAGAMIAICTGIWLSLMTALQVPLWWSVGGVVACLLGWTWWLAPRWAFERRFATGRRLAVAVFVVPPLVILAGIAYWRAFEFAGFGPTSPALFAVLYPHDFIQMQGTQLEYRNTLIDELKSEIADQLNPSIRNLEEIRNFELIEDAATTISKHILGPLQDDSKPFDEGLQEGRDSFWLTYDLQLQRIMKLTSQNQSPAMRHWLNASPSFIQAHQLVLNRAGQLRIEEGRLDDALSFFCASLRMATFWATQSSLKHRMEADIRQTETLRQIVLWANHPDQTPQSIKQAMKKVCEELNLFPTWRQSLVAEYLLNIQALDRSVELDDMEPLPGPLALIRESSRYLPWERLRSRHLIERQLIANEARMWRASTMIASSNGIDVPRFLEQLPSLFDDQPAERYVSQTSFPMSSLFKDQTLMLAACFDREATIRITLLGLALQAWKLEHGSWPESLAELFSPDTLESLPLTTIVDPWCGEQFRYRPDTPESENSPAEILYSVGPDQVRDVLMSDNRHALRKTKNGLFSGRMTRGGGAARDAASENRVLLQVKERRLLPVFRRRSECVSLNREMLE
ncbi:MAG: hypothetical protein WCJ09_15945 [Planctomycetota bacterium]